MAHPDYVGTVLVDPAVLSQFCHRSWPPPWSPATSCYRLLTPDLGVSTNQQQLVS